MESNVAIGIKRIMTEKGLLQKAVAARAGFSEQQLCDMLNDRKIIRADYLPAISKSLGVGIPEIYEKGRADPSQ